MLGGWGCTHPLFVALQSVNELRTQLLDLATARAAPHVNTVAASQVNIITSSAKCTATHGTLDRSSVIDWYNT